MSELLLPSIMQSIKPQYCELIASGKKTIEVRKTKPKILTPFKVYIYCAKDKTPFLLPTYSKGNLTDSDIWKMGNGKVIGEYICNEISDYCYDTTYGLYRPINEKGFFITDNDVPLDDMCLNQTQLIDYGKNEDLHARHISDLKIYDKPKELNDFYVSCKGNGTADDKMCINCPYLLFDYDELNGHTRWCGVHKMKPLTRSPKSWCYVGFNDDTYIDLWQALQSGKFPIGLHKTNNHFFSLSNYTNEELNILLKNKEVVELFRRLGLMNIEQLAKDLAE